MRRIAGFKKSWELSWRIYFQQNLLFSLYPSVTGYTTSPRHQSGARGPCIGAQAFNSITREGLSLNLRPVKSTEHVPGQPELHSETLCKDAQWSSRFYSGKREQTSESCSLASTCTLWCASIHIVIHTYTHTHTHTHTHTEGGREGESITRWCEKLVFCVSQCLSMKSSHIHKSKTEWSLCLFSLSIMWNVYLHMNNIIT